MGEKALKGERQGKTRGESPWGQNKAFRNWICDPCFGLPMVFGDYFWRDLAKPPTGHMNGWNDLIAPIISYRPC